MPANEWIATQVRADQHLSSTVWKKVWLCCGLLLSVFSARAEAPTPPREFWDYMMEFSDDNGEVFDPADLAVIDKVKEKIPAGKTADSQPSNSSAGPAVEKPGIEKPAAVGEPVAGERKAQ